MINLRRTAVSVLAGVLLSLAALAAPASAAAHSPAQASRTHPSATVPTKAVPIRARLGAVPSAVNQGAPVVTSWTFTSGAGGGGNWDENRPTPSPSVTGFVMWNGFKFSPGGEVDVTWSNGISERLIMQTDGNLVLYVSNGKTWGAGTNRSAGGNFADMQADGNFVVYDVWQNPIWATGTNGANTYLYLQSDGNMVIYRAMSIAGVSTLLPLWDTKTY